MPPSLAPINHVQQAYEMPPSFAQIKHEAKKAEISMKHARQKMLEITVPQAYQMPPSLAPIKHEAKNPPTIDRRKTGLRIAIMTASDLSFISGQYQNHFQSAQCYAQKNGYSLIHEEDGNLFRRHLAVKKHLVNFDWIYQVDADVMFVNFDNKLETYIIRAGTADIIFPMRIINGEIVAGGYLVRNSEWSRNFLEEWGTRGSNHQSLAIRNSVVENADNGFLMQLLTFKLFVEEETGDMKEKGNRCVELFNQEYNRGKCCLSSLMANRRRFKHVWILRRGSGFFRDDFVGSFFFKEDLSIHHKGRWKKEMGSNFFMDTAKQCRNFSGAVLPNLVLSGAFRDRLLCETDFTFAQAGHAGQFNPDIYQCFPDCPDEVPTNLHIPTMQV